MIFLDHQECRSSSVCGTTHRNPQITHRTFLFSLYRSTSKSSYILGRGGLGDQPAEGVIPTDRNLFGGSVCSDHNDVPNFEVSAEWNDTHWFDLRPAAISCRQQLHHGGKHDCHFCPNVFDFPKPTSAPLHGVWFRSLRLRRMAAPRRAADELSRRLGELRTKRYRISRTLERYLGHTLSRRGWALMTAALTLSSLLIAILVPVFSDLVAVIGALTSGPLGFAMPALLFDLAKI